MFSQSIVTTIIAQLFQKDIEDMIKEGDLDEDGKINFDEFMIIMSSK